MDPPGVIMQAVNHKITADSTTIQDLHRKFAVDRAPEIAQFQDRSLTPERSVRGAVYWHLKPMKQNVVVIKFLTIALSVKKRLERLGVSKSYSRNWTVSPPPTLLFLAGLEPASYNGCGQRTLAAFNVRHNNRPKRPDWLLCAFIILRADGLLRSRDVTVRLGWDGDQARSCRGLSLSFFSAKFGAPWFSIFDSR